MIIAGEYPLKYTSFVSGIMGHMQIKYGKLGILYIENSYGKKPEMSQVDFP